ncbi:MAG: hypothetical protein KME03_19675 [Aphanocapsa lilacina HA4352-LM1]|jgi:hypothetical protein|nr:hypothetical protein [Aphanocapsa lilacina HA4352-LM1]
MTGGPEDSRSVLKRRIELTLWLIEQGVIAPERGDELIVKHIREFAAEGAAANPAVYSSPPAARPLASVTQRLLLFERLNRLPYQQLNMLAFVLKVAPGILPPQNAPHGDRVYQLLVWAESEGGCGLQAVIEVLEQLG